MSSLEAKTIVTHAASLDLATLARVAAGPVRLEFDESDWQAVAAAQATIATILATGRTVYGVNTGFGRLAQTQVPADRLGQLQRNLLLSHATGVGDPLGDDVVRMILALKANALVQGHSGVRPEVVRVLLALLAHDLLPVVPGQGSVGASGDLAPLAHLSLPLIGEGRVRVGAGGAVISGREALARLDLAPIALEAKEGLALLNGTQVSTALGLAGLLGAERCCASALVAGAMSVEAARGSRAPFDTRIHRVRGQHGQIAAASILRALLESSDIGASHIDCNRVQDPYSLRCQPQVMGACLDQMRFAGEILVREANAVSDNPLVFAGSGDDEACEILSGGNFHAEPVAMAADNLALAIAEIGALSERRIALLIDASLSQLPAFLTPEPGLNSGFMIAHVTAASLASENKSLAHPASVDSLPTSANQEDHVSMATFAGRRLGAMNTNVARIVAIELLAAAQGLDFHRPLRSSTPIERAHAAVRSVAAGFEEDRYFSGDIEAVGERVADGTLGRLTIDAVRRHLAGD